MLIRVKKFVIALIFALSMPCLATESDPYTFSDIQLADASKELSYQFNVQLQKTVQLTNKWMSNRNTKDTEVISYFFKAWQFSRIEYLKNFEFRAFYKSLFISTEESCLKYNNCPGWGKIERILLYPGESIFYEANYNLITKTYLSPIINLCGVRVGADKLTHFSGDGIQYFKLWIQGKTLDEISKLSWETESGSMGQSYTGVMSRADHRVNLTGVRFFQNFFWGPNSYIFMSNDRTLKIRKKIDICEFVSKEWNEALIQGDNIYTGSRKNQLQLAIENRIKIPNPRNLSKQSIIDRTYVSPSLWEDFRVDPIGAYLTNNEEKSRPYIVNESAILEVVSAIIIEPTEIIQQAQKIESAFAN